MTDRTRPRPEDPERFRHLPDAVRLEDTITSSETGPRPDEKDDYWREVEWMLRVTGGGA